MVERGLVAVLGVPGTGKSAVGSRLARLLGFKFTTLSWLVLRRGLWTEYDAERRSFVVDGGAVARALSSMDRWVVETHWLEPLLETGRLAGVVVTRADPRVVWRRLERRGWPLRKIAENVEAELLGVSASEALEAARRGVAVVEVDTTRLSPMEAAARALEGLRRGGGGCCIDWLQLLGSEAEELLEHCSRARGL